MKPSNIIILLFAFLLASCKLPFTSNFEIDSKNSTPDNSATSNDQNDKRIIVGLKSDQEFLIEALPFNSDPEGPAPIANTLKVVSNRPALEDTVINVSYSGNFSNNNFSSMPMTVTIPKDQSEAVLQLITINDAITEPFKTIVIQLSATNPDIAFEEKDSVFEFRDDDPLSLSIAPYKVNGLITNDIGIEGAMDGIKYDVTMSSASPRVPSHDVILKLKNLTGTLSADDFVNDINTIIFPAGTGSMVFEFHVKQDSLDEGIEAATLTYELSNYAGKGRGNIVFNLRVLDDEIPSIDMKNADSCVTVNESDVRTCQILLRRSGDIADPLSIPFSFSGLATHGSDYIMSTSANFKSGEAAITVDVSFTNDTVFEDLEDAIIKTQQLQGYSCFCDTGLEFFITDDDGSPEGRSVEITGVANMLNSTITLNWPNDFDFISYKVYRRELGETSWGPVLANLPAGQQTYTDSNVISGKVYEYKVERKKWPRIHCRCFQSP